MVQRLQLQAQPAFLAAFELLPSVWTLLSGRRASAAGALNRSNGGALPESELRSLGDLSWLTGLLLLGLDCGPSLSPSWASCLQQVYLSHHMHPFLQPGRECAGLSMHGSWLTGLLLQGLDYPTSLSRAWASYLQQMTAVLQPLHEMRDCFWLLSSVSLGIASPHKSYGW